MLGDVSGCCGAADRAGGPAEQRVCSQAHVSDLNEPHSPPGGKSRNQVTLRTPTTALPLCVSLCPHPWTPFQPEAGPPSQAWLRGGLQHVWARYVCVRKSRGCGAARVGARNSVCGVGFAQMLLATRPPGAVASLYVLCVCGQSAGGVGSVSLVQVCVGRGL